MGEHIQDTFVGTPFKLRSGDWGVKVDMDIEANPGVPDINPGETWAHTVVTRAGEKWLQATKFFWVGNGVALGERAELEDVVEAGGDDVDEAPF